MHAQATPQSCFFSLVVVEEPLFASQMPAGEDRTSIEVAADAVAEAAQAAELLQTGDASDQSRRAVEPEQLPTLRIKKSNSMMEAMQPVVVQRFLASMDVGAENSDGRFLQTIRQTDPWHPVIHCVLSREPYNRKEVLELSRLFLHFCTGCGKTHKEAKLTRCAGCEVAYFCDEKCARRANKRHHSTMCGRLRELHDLIMPSMIQAKEKKAERSNEQWKARMRELLNWFYGFLTILAGLILLWGMWSVANDMADEQNRPYQITQHFGLPQLGWDEWQVIGGGGE